MTVLEQLRVVGDSEPPPEPPRRSPVLPAVALVVVVGLIAALPGATMSADDAPIDTIGEESVAPLFAGDAPTPEQLADAIRLAESLVAAVNSADSERVIALLAPTLQDDGLGASQWPTLWGDIGWWGETFAGAALDVGAVTDFVRYFRTMPGGVVIEECSAAAVGADGMIGATCTYGASGGLRGLMGDREAIENGEMVVMVHDGYVAGVTNHSVVNEETWKQFRTFIAGTNLERPFRVDKGGPFRPLYSGESAMQLAAAAMAYAESIDAVPIPFG